MSKFLQLLGFAQKAGVLNSGTDTVRSQIKKGKAKLVIGAIDLSERLWSDIEKECDFRQLTYIRQGTKLELGTAIGKSPRGLIVITDQHFAAQVLKILKAENLM